MERVAILDAGAQYGKVIDRRVRELSVCSDLLPINTTLDKLLESGYKGVIISGSPDSVGSHGAASCDPKIFESGLPILGICYGMQHLEDTWLEEKVVKTASFSSIATRRLRYLKAFRSAKRFYSHTEISVSQAEQVST
ncbi:hypothetical protein EG68_12620 [Paragonimus skrjabini miyazakii]|uniref:Glutamine amidotransferase domain-containing protein n=1 Tax=Paragonimus skrjabini miyazakii TaxID=59628 RepID=A0A8S9YJ21_9TREM|nr:hypothetical protein EG68_12620 [Paragonimus skrjabini miyazakii]